MVSLSSLKRIVKSRQSKNGHKDSIQPPGWLWECKPVQIVLAHTHSLEYSSDLCLCSEAVVYWDGRRAKRWRIILKIKELSICPVTLSHYTIFKRIQILQMQVNCVWGQNKEEERKKMQGYWKDLPLRSSGLRLFFATSASAPMPRPTASPLK